MSNVCKKYNCDVINHYPNVCGFHKLCVINSAECPKAKLLAMGGVDSKIKVPVKTLKQFSVLNFFKLNLNIPTPYFPLSVCHPCTHTHSQKDVIVIREVALLCFQQWRDLVEFSLVLSTVYFTRLCKIHSCIHVSMFNFQNLFWWGLLGMERRMQWVE